MRLPEGGWVHFDEVDSTQSQAGRYLRGEVEGPVPLAIRADVQTAGRGRFGRVWHDERGKSLCLSLILRGYEQHAKPWLLGMGLACAAAGVQNCRVRWPNDLYLDGKKLGGILTEIVEGVPVLGIGVNLGQTKFPDEIADGATSLVLHRPGIYESEEVARHVLRRFEGLPEVSDWGDLAPIWSLYDDTPGKRFRLPTGEEAVAMGIGPQGELLCAVEGEARSVMAADILL